MLKDNNFCLIKKKTKKTKKNKQNAISHRYLALQKVKEYFLCF